MLHRGQTRVLLLNDMERLEKTLFRLEQGMIKKILSHF